MKGHFAAFATAIALIGATDALAQDRSACTIPVATPLTVTLGEASASSDPVASAERLVTEGRLAEARSQLQLALSGKEVLVPDRAAFGWSLAALSAISEGDVTSALAAASRSEKLLDSATGASVAPARLVLAWAEAEIGNVPRTRRAFDAAATAARAAGDDHLFATTLVHRALLESRINAPSASAIGAAEAAIARLPGASARAKLRVALALAAMPESRTAPRHEAHALAPALLNAAFRDADAARAPRELAAALGLLGEWQWLSGDARGAVPTLERAVAASRALPSDPWRFRWSWKLGVAQRESGLSGITRLQEAVDQLEVAKTRGALGRFAASTLARGYRRAYLDLADAQLADGAGLDKVRATLELSRAAEIEDFFRDPCLAARSARVPDPERLDPTAALIHPVLFDDRIEILVSHRSGIVRFTTRKDAAAVGREVQRLRNAVERPGSLRYRESAGRLHQWLVTPIEDHLGKLGVKTLVWVPDGALRGLPFGALHDGRSHLVERFALAVTPVATLTDPRPLAATGLRASLSGLTVAAQGFAPLPGAGIELDTLSSLLGTTALRDERFTVAALRETLRRAPVNALHVASHGQFAPEAGETFLVAHDGRFTMPQLRAALAAGKVREEPLELIVLSACQTAAGDERAALGLAGVAISAGARSAVATLWAVSDESTSVVTTGFYRALLEGKASRAEALRRAQLAVLRDPRYDHPFFWAPYTLIGNWM